MVRKLLLHLDLLSRDKYTGIPNKYFVCLHKILKRSSRHVFKTSCRHVFKTSSRYVFKRSSGHVFKTSSRRLERRKTVTLKTCRRRLQDVFKTNRCLLGKFFFAYWCIAIISFWYINQYSFVVTIQIFIAFVFEQFSLLPYSFFLISLGVFSPGLFLLNLLLMVDAILLYQICFTVTCEIFKIWDRLLWRYVSLFCRCENCCDTDMTLVSLNKNWIWLLMASKIFSDMGQYTYDVYENCLNFQEPPTPCPSTSKMFSPSWLWKSNFKQIPSPYSLQQTM